jgi:chromosome segregation ATPase
MTTGRTRFPRLLAALLGTLMGLLQGCSSESVQQDIQTSARALVGQEGALDAEIRYLQAVNGDTERLNDELGGKIDEVTARTNTAVESLKAGQMTETELAQLHAILDHEVAEARKQLEVVSQELESAQQYRARQPDLSSAALDAQIEQLQNLLAQVQRRTRAMSAQRDRI